MDKIKVSYDRTSFFSKPTEKVASIISNSIGRSVKQLDSSNIKSFALNVSLDGHTFCPATFKDGKRCKENFEQQQLIALDFDNKAPDKKVSFEAVKSRANYYDLPILFAYETLSSKSHDKFRVVFLNDVPIPHRKVAEAMQLAMGTVFPEADPSCYKDISKMYYGGKELIYFDNELPEINVESVFRNLTHFMKDKHKANHYKERLSKFSQETGIALTEKGLLDVIVSDNPTESSGANQSNQNGKNSPSSIIYTLTKSNIIANGEIFPKKYYRINLVDGTSKPSVTTSDNRTDVVNKQYKNHEPYRSSDITEMSQKCRLFKEFESGDKDMNHDELFGLATNLIQIEKGETRFKKIQAEHPNFYNTDRRKKWANHLSYMKQQSYKPQCCDGFCPYHAECNHGTNILSTVHPKRGTMEKIPGYKKYFYPIVKAEEDVYQAIYKAYCATDASRYVVKAMVGIGKTTSYLRLMTENPEDRFIIAAPTNLLKDEIFNKAKKLGIDMRKTPSLEQIKSEIPSKVWNHIQRLYKSGQHRSVHPYIFETLKKKDIPCLREYLVQREKLKTFDGSVITTHRYLLNMDEKRLREYDAIIIDEDIIFKSVISNQGEIPVTKLKKLLAETTDRRLSKKIKKLLKLAETQSCIELDCFEWEDETGSDDISTPFDISSFCLADRFYLRKASREDKLKEDTITFLKPANFKKVKYIMVSATVNENICREFFHEDNVDFYECKCAEYKGDLYQYPSKSMSRTCVANNPGIIRRLMKRVGIGEDKVITFKKEAIGHLHFGNTEGSNTLEGEEILVAGTPYHAEFLYKLATFTMGLDFDEDEEMTDQIVMHNGCRFWFKTFKNENLRSVHFWMIESELEQAVGRARLLRNKCKVHLFSNFPLSQAKMITDFDYNKD